MNPTPHAQRAPRRTSGWKRTAIALVVPAALVAASCAGDDDDTADIVDTAEPAVTDTTEPIVSDTTEPPGTSVEAPEGTAVEDTAVEEPDSEAVDVLTETLAGAGVDTFLTLLPLVGFEEVTEADQITIFAPTDEAFTSVAADELAAIVEDPQQVVDVLQAHVVEGLVTAADLEEMSTVQPIRGEALDVSVDGEQIMIGDAMVVEAGIEFEGGIIHVIDNLLLLEGTMDPAEGESEAADVLTETMAGEGVDVFLTLLPLVGFEEVTEADQITIFAPSDEAFTSIPADELAAIIADPQQVVDILQAHVVEGLVTAADLEEMSTVQPIRGEALDVTVDGDQIMIGEATVVEAGIEFEGGIIHVIDDVLLLDEL